MLEYDLSFHIFCSLKLTVFLELCSSFLGADSVCWQNNIQAYFRAKWRLLFIYSPRQSQVVYGCRQWVWTPLLAPLLDPSIFLMRIQKRYKLKLYTICVPPIHTTASFGLKFPSVQHSAQKKVFPFIQHILKFSFSTSEGVRNVLAFNY